MTDSYSVVIKRSAEKELKKFPLADLRRVIDRLNGLAQSPRPSGCEKLSGEADQYRIRQGDYSGLCTALMTMLVLLKSSRSDIDEKSNR